ncbi:CBS domain-containing protein [Streptomyces laurentii]|uniref:CBS domain-containing protein n=1 Tax=Streptomyces laurentii TaxID=39478 RepID=UPI003683AB26
MPAQPFTVADVMTRKVVAVRPDTEFKDIVAAMDRWKVTALPVIKGEGRVVGVVSEADLLVKEEYRDRRPGVRERLRHLDAMVKAGSRNAGDLMTSPAVTIGPDAPLPRAARILATRRVKRLPVVDAGGVLQGIVSRADLLKVFLRTDEELAAEIRRDVVDHLFPVSRDRVEVRVRGGVVHLSGEVHDSTLVPLAARLARTVEGVVDVRSELTAADDA